MSTTAEAELIARAREGDHVAWEALIRTHATALRKFLVRLVGEAADDVGQDTLLLAFRKLASFDERATFRTWLLAIAINCARSRRSRSNKRDAKLESVGGIELALRGESAPALTPEEEVAVRELRQVLDAAIERLDPDLQVVIALVHFDDCSEPEASELLGWPRGTVASRLRRARSDLREMMEKAGVSTVVVAGALELLNSGLQDPAYAEQAAPLPAPAPAPISLVNRIAIAAAVLGLGGTVALSLFYRAPAVDEHATPSTRVHSSMSSVDRATPEDTARERDSGVSGRDAGAPPSAHEPPRTATLSADSAWARASPGRAFGWLLRPLGSESERDVPWTMTATDGSLRMTSEPHAFHLSVAHVMVGGFTVEGFPAVSPADCVSTTSCDGDYAGRLAVGLCDISAGCTSNADGARTTWRESVIFTGILADDGLLLFASFRANRPDGRWGQSWSTVWEGVRRREVASCDYLPGSANPPLPVDPADIVRGLCPTRPQNRACAILSGIDPGDPARGLAPFGGPTTGLSDAWRCPTGIATPTPPSNSVVARW